MIEKLEEDRGDHKVDEYQAGKDGRASRRDAVYRMRWGLLPSDMPHPRGALRPLSAFAGLSPDTG